MLTRTIDSRFVVTRNGADYTELQPIRSSDPMVYMDETAEIKVSMSGDFAVNDAVNWLTDQIRPELNVDGVWTPLGVFLPATVRPTKDESAQSVHMEAYDRTWLVRDNYTETILHFNAGRKYTDVVKQLLTAAGVVVMLVTPSSAVLTEAREDWAVGTSYLTIINKLLSEINYNPLWFNSQGAAVIEPASVPDADSIKHILDSSNVRSLLLPQISRETDVYQAPNVFVCIVSNADKSGPMVARAVNNNLQSPLSVARRGRRIVKVVNVDNIASQTELQAYADRLCSESLFTGETITVKTALLPGYGVGDITALHYDDLTAICIERAWTMEIRPGGSMTHKLERVVVALE